MPKPYRVFFREILNILGLTYSSYLSLIFAIQNLDGCSVSTLYLLSFIFYFK